MTQSRFAIACMCLALAVAGCGRAPGPGGFVIQPSSTPGPTAYNPVRLAINSIQGPPQATIGAPVTLTVGVVLPDSCTKYDHLEVTVDDQTATVTLTARGLEALGLFCTQSRSTQALIYQTVSTTFTPARGGIYTIRAVEGDAVTSIDVH